MKTLLETLKYYNLRMKIKQLVTITILNHIFENIYTILLLLLLLLLLKLNRKLLSKEYRREKNYINTLFAGVGHSVLRLTVSSILDLEYGRRLQAEGCTQDRGHRFSQ